MKTVLWILFGIAVIGGAWQLFRGLQAPSIENSQNQDVSGNILIGAILPLTGNDAGRGLAIQKAGKLALEEINAEGGIDGRVAEVIWEDGKCDGEASLKAAQKLIMTDKVKYILGGICSSEVLAGARFAENSGVVWISPSATSPDITNAGDYIFRTAPSDTLASVISAQYAFTSMGAKAAAIISENESSTQILRQTFREAFERLGGKIVADEIYKSGDSNFRASALKIKSSKADVVYMLSQTKESAVLLAKQLKDQKIASRMIVGGASLEKDTIQQNAKVLEGVVSIEPHFDMNLLSFVEFVEKFKQKYNATLLFERDMANYYSAFYLLKTAIENAGDNARMVKDWLYTVKDWEHALGKLSFDSNGDRLAEYAVREVISGAAEEKEVITLQ